MSEKSLFAATFASVLAAVALGCDSDPVDAGPDPNPISIGGYYEYGFEVTSSDSREEIKCAGAGTITITQESDIRFSGKTAADGTLFCTHFGPFFSGVVDIGGEIIGTQIDLEVPLDGSGACALMGTVEGNPVTRMSGDAMCLVDPEALALPGHLFELNGSWRAKRKDS